VSELGDLHRSYIGSYRKLVEHSPGGEIRPTGNVFTFVSGLPVAIFNGCVIVTEASSADLKESLRWLGGRPVPYEVAAVEELVPALEPTLTAAGLHPHATTTGMVLSPVPEPPDPPPGIATVEGLTDEMAAYVPPSMQADPDVRAFTATLDGHPAGTAIAIRTDSVGGVYAVGTHPEARRRGVGTAASWAAVGAARAWGCESVVLQSTEMGYPIYKRMGFRPIVRYAIFR
jgi:GNAT superfamily N-acetyltransferase